MITPLEAIGSVGAVDTRIPSMLMRLTVIAIDKCMAVVGYAVGGLRGMLWLALRAGGTGTRNSECGMLGHDGITITRRGAHGSEVLVGASYRFRCGSKATAFNCPPRQTCPWSCPCMRRGSGVQCCALAEYAGA